MTISVQNLSKNFGAFSALKDISLDFPQGELSALLGPSGCGKTTLLRIIAGLEFADQGKILFDGEDASQRHVRERQVGFVFQHYALFKHMTIFENVAFGLRVKSRKERPSEQQIQEKVHQLLDLVQLDFLAQQYPAQLSGGQRQRIALARALAVEPKVLLLDEPFGALDAKVRKELRRWLRRLHDDLHVTSIFVTHDQDEALDVADQIVIMNHGVVEQIGSPNQVYQHPASPFVYGFLGNVNVLHGHVHEGVLHTGSIQLSAPEHQNAQHQAGTAYIRPHDVEIQTYTPTLASTKPSGIPAKLKRIHGIGAYAQLELQVEDDHHIIEAIIPSEQALQQNLQINQSVLLHPKRVQVFLNTPAVQAA